jgi:hypothetical protein
MTLDQARQKARAWLEMIGKGIDPKVDEERQKAAARRRQANTFAAVAADFLDRHAKKLAKKEEADRIVKGEFVKRWAARPITDIAPQEVSAAIRAIVNRGALYQATTPLATCAASSIGRSEPANTASTPPQSSACSRRSSSASARFAPAFCSMPSYGRFGRLLLKWVIPTVRSSACSS